MAVYASWLLEKIFAYIYIHLSVTNYAHRSLQLLSAARNYNTAAMLAYLSTTNPQTWQTTDHIVDSCPFTNFQVVLRFRTKLEKTLSAG